MIPTSSPFTVAGFARDFLREARECTRPAKSPDIISFLLCVENLTNPNVTLVAGQVCALLNLTAIIEDEARTSGQPPGWRAAIELATYLNSCGR